jgi:hypothetical protein
MEVDPTRLKPDDVVNRDCVVEVTAPSTPVLFRGPIPVVITVTNRSARHVEVWLLRPMYSGLRFDSPSATRKIVVPPPSYLAGPVPLAPGERISKTYYLNRYLDFSTPGPIRVTYRLSLRVDVSKEGPHEYLIGRGELTYMLVETGDEAVKEELSKYAAGVKGEDHLESDEALGFLDTPLALEYKARKLAIWDLEPDEIRMLGRSSSPSVHLLIVHMLTSDRPDLVLSAQQALAHLGPAMPRDKVRRLLTASNPRIRGDALEVLTKHPDANDRAAVSPLLDDPDAGVREKAKAYLEALTK